MRGHVVRRGKHSWAIVLEQYEGGKRRPKWLAFRGNKKQAEDRLVELQRQADTGGLILTGKTTVADFLSRWLSDYCEPNVGTKTFEGYKDIVEKRLVPHLGNTRLMELRPERIQRLYADLLRSGRLDGKGGLSARTVQVYHQCLHRALRTAVEWRLLNTNPADSVRPPRVQHHEITTLDEDDALTVLEAAKSTPYRSLLFLALHTGLRRGELLGLKWMDCDLVRSQIWVSRSLYRRRDGRIDITPPKTKKGRRAVALSPATALMLKAHKEKEQALCAELGCPFSEDDFVFSDPNRKPLLPDTVTHAWIRLRKALGLNSRLHDLRHSHATALLKQGIHPKIVQERLGHANIGITIDTYSQVAPGLQEAAAKSFDEWLSTGQPRVENSKTPNAR